MNYHAVFVFFSLYQEFLFMGKNAQMCDLHHYWADFLFAPMLHVTFTLLFFNYYNCHLTINSLKSGTLPGSCQSLCCDLMPGGLQIELRIFSLLILLLEALAAPFKWHICNDRKWTVSSGRIMHCLQPRHKPPGRGCRFLWQSVPSLHIVI